MSAQHSANCEDRIEFIIALMTEDYTKARDVGARLLKHDCTDVNVNNALMILKNRKQPEMKIRRRPSSTDRPIASDSECEEDGDANPVNDNFDMQIDARTENKVASCNTESESNSHNVGVARTPKLQEKLAFKQKMHRVIAIRVDKEIDQQRSSASR